jgi:flagellar protein FliT
MSFPGEQSGPHGSGVPSDQPDGSLIEYYQSIARASHGLLEAAYQGDWTRFEAIAHQCRELIAALKDASVELPLNGDEQQRRIEILRGILRDDACIRARTEPWLRDLDEFLA